MANNQYSSNYRSFSPEDVHVVDMDRRADWGETDVNNPSYIAGKPAIPASQIQADWNQATDTAKDYIKNKPSIPALPSAPAAGLSDATYVLKVDTEGVASWVAAE